MDGVKTLEGPKISIIVPVYKVEPYLRKCLDSIVNQTYENLEIILVDDGSPDSCGAICDEYAARDERIRVIHQPNGGLSAARNRGLEAAAGDYVAFVDSDDWVEPDMYGYLLSGAEQVGADIAVCGIFEELPDRQVCRHWQEAETFDTEGALEQLFLRKKYSHSAWDKLYRRTLFDGVRFPEGRNFEDIATTYRVFEKARTVQLMPEAKYHYLQRPDSIMGDGSLRNRVDSYLAAKAQYLDMKDRWPQFRGLLEAWCISVAAGIWGVYLGNPKEAREEYRSTVEEIAAFAGEHPDAVKRAEESLGLAGRLAVRLTSHTGRWAFALAGVINGLYRAKHGRPL